MSKKDLYRFEEEQSLEQKASELKNGNISFSNDVTLKLPEKAVLDIDVDQRDKADVTATSVEIKLKWAE